MPFVTDIAHDKRVVERNTASRKHGRIREECRMDLLDSERMDTPVVRVKPDAIESGGIVSN